MKPLNSKEAGCNPISSNCVIWQGADIPCMDLCKGDTISDVTNKLATELCQILDVLKVSAYDLSCFNLTSCAPETFTEFIQFLISRICNLETCTGCAPGCDTTPVVPGTPTAGCPDCMMNLASCFYFTNGLGDEVTTLQMQDYITAIGNKICYILQATGLTNTVVAAQGDRIGKLETEVTILQTNPPVQFQNMNTCILPTQQNGYPLDIIVSQLAINFCQLQSELGTVANMQYAEIQQCANLNNSPRLGVSGGTPPPMSTIPGWTISVETLSDSIANMWLTICDLRAAVQNIQLNCCSSGCDGVILALDGSNVGTSLTLYLTGTIPAGFAQCTGSTNIVITDSIGGSATVAVDIFAMLNQPSGYSITLPGSINIATNLTISIPYQLCNSITGANCGSFLQKIINNTIPCPSLIVNSFLDTEIDFNYITDLGNYTYTTQLFDATGLTLLASQSNATTAIVPISGVFTGLAGGTPYKVRLSIIPTGCSVCVPTICTFVDITTIPAVTCLAPAVVVTTTTYIP